MAKSFKYQRVDKVPLPPKDAKVYTTACDYCVVGCGYKAYVWPDGKEGGPKAYQNAFGIDYPVPALSGRWVSPNQYNQCYLKGKKHHVVVVPDGDAKVVNRGGNHSIRGGCIAQKIYNPDGPTWDRLKNPQIRVNGKLTDVPWDLALGVMADISRYIIDKYGESAWGMKTYSYAYFENTYAISKLAFESIQTPAYSEHDKPGPGNDTPGTDDAGIDAFGASYDDFSQAEVIFISGTDPFETKTILFTEWIMKGHPNKIIMVNPRKSAGAAYAEKTGGLHLSIIPGTDTLLHLALARLILEKGWEDKEFIEQYVSNRYEIDSGFGRGPRNTPVEWRTTWGKFGATFKEYRDWVLSYAPAELGFASQKTGIPKKQIEKTAELIAMPVNGKRPKTSFGFEKGNYWSNNYLNTTSFASLGLICGAGNRSGRVIARLGGHQRGWLGAADYPRIQSPEKFPGRRKKEIDLDRWVEAGKLRFAWVIGTTWTAAMAASQELANTFRKLTKENPQQIDSLHREDIVKTLKARVDSGGMVVAHQDIYLRQPMGTEFADFILPGAGWGESDFTRCNGERRLRLYSKFYDPPGEAKPDWWIISRFAKQMGFKGYDWEDANQVFEEAARFSRGGVLNYHPLVVYAKKIGMRAHDLLRELRTHGIQTPIRFRTKPTEPREYLDYAGYYRSDKTAGMLVGTKRLHDPTLDPGVPEGPTVHQKWLTQFNTHSGKAILHKSPWEVFSDFYERITPKGDELWVTSGRINEIWQSAYDDMRRPYAKERWPDNFVEVHPADAATRGIESGDFIEIVNDDVLVQTGGFVGIDDDDLSFTKLQERGLIRVGRGNMQAVAIVTEAVRPGVVFANFLHTHSTANSLVHRVPDPISNRYRFKLGKGRIRKIGESPYKKSLDEMTLKPRTVMPEVKLSSFKQDENAW